MQKSPLLQRLALASVSISVLAACAPEQSPTTPMPSGSPVPSATPDNTTSPEPTATPSAMPTEAPTPEPTAMPSALPSADGSGSPAPLPTATSDISVIERTTFNGSIYDNTNAPLDQVTVRARSLNGSVAFDETTTTAGGSYAFNNAPAGVQIEIVASRPGYTTRRRVEVLKSNKQGDPDANKYDFGPNTTNGTNNNALSDLPEVTRVSPGRNASGIDPKTSFVLGFSEPMDRKTVEDTFTVRAYNSRKLTVDSGSAANTLTGPGEIPTVNGTRIWDKDAFNISWNSDDSEVTFSFKEERLLPTDKDSNLVPDYQVAFNSFDSGDRILKDKSGISRNENHFKLTDGPFEQSAKFSIRPDTTVPSLTGVTAETNENGGQNGDAIRVRYSERMIIYARDKSIAGGMDGINGSATKAPAAYPGTGESANSRTVARNYDVRLVGQGGVTKYAGNWAALGGTAVYDTTDLTHKTVLLRPSLSGFTVQQGFVINVQGFGTLRVALTFEDGSTETLETGELEGDYQSLQDRLNELFDNAPVTVTAVNANGTPLALNELMRDQHRYLISLRQGASSSGFRVRDMGGDSRVVRSISFVSGPLSTLGIPTDHVLLVGSNDTLGTLRNLYTPGDTVRVTVSSTVLDPAGNSIDTSRDDASANAS